MILVSMYFFDDNIWSVLRQRFEAFLEVGQHALIEKATAVFGRPHQMVVARKDTVSHSSIHGHIFSIAANQCGHTEYAQTPEGTSSHELTLGELRGRIRPKGIVLVGELGQFETEYGINEEKLA